MDVMTEDTWPLLLFPHSKCTILFSIASWGVLPVWIGILAIYNFFGITMVGGKVVIGGRRLAAVLRAFCMRS